MLGKLPRDRCGNDHVIRSRVKKASSQSIPTDPAQPAAPLVDHRRYMRPGRLRRWRNISSSLTGRNTTGGSWSSCWRWTSSVEQPPSPWGATPPNSRALLLPTASGTAGTRTPAQKPPDWGHNADQLTPTSQCAATRTFLWIRHIYAGMPGGSKGREGGV